MRRIERSDCPNVIARLRLAADERVREQLARGEQSRLRFSTHVYAAVDVRTELGTLQHEKCGYCESLLQPAALGQIDHFRPKGEVKNETTQAMLRPGYYWLAHDWDNLILSCDRCNTRYKGSRFPLVVEADRQRTVNQGGLPAEQPLLLNPYIDDVRVNLRFREEFIFASQGTEASNKTIDVLGLDREDLNTARRKALAIVKGLVFVAVAGPESLRDSARNMIIEYFSPRGEFASCINDNIDYDSAVAPWRHEVVDIDDRVGNRPVGI